MLPLDKGGVRGGFLPAIVLALIGVISFVLLPPTTAGDDHPSNNQYTADLAAAEHNRALLRQTQDQAMAKSEGCLSCHLGVEKAHASRAVKLGCTDCHGGDAGPSVADGTSPNPSPISTPSARHIPAALPEAWSDEQGRRSAANPVRSYTLLNRESPEFVRFVNPGDLRVAQSPAADATRSRSTR